MAVTHRDLPNLDPKLRPNKPRKVEQSMAGITGAVYDPPRKGLPYLAVALGPDGELLVARAVPALKREPLF